MALHRIQSGRLLGTVAKFRQYIIFRPHKEILQKLANIFERTNHGQAKFQSYESINCIVFIQLVIKQCNASLVKKQTC